MVSQDARYFYGNTAIAFATVSGMRMTCVKTINALVTGGMMLLASALNSQAAVMASRSDSEPDRNPFTVKKAEKQSIDLMDAGVLNFDPETRLAIDFVFTHLPGFENRNFVEDIARFKMLTGQFQFRQRELNYLTNFSFNDFSTQAIYQKQMKQTMNNPIIVDTAAARREVINPSNYKPSINPSIYKSSFLYEQPYEPAALATSEPAKRTLVGEFVRWAFREFAAAGLFQKLAAVFATIISLALIFKVTEAKE